MASQERADNMRQSIVFPEFEIEFVCADEHIAAYTPNQGNAMGIQTVRIEVPLVDGGADWDNVRIRSIGDAVGFFTNANGEEQVIEFMPLYDELKRVESQALGYAIELYNDPAKVGTYSLKEG